MIELDLIFTASEERNLVDRIFGLGGWFHPDMDYDTPEPIRVDTYERYCEYRNLTRQMFVLHRSYFVTPLQLKPVLKGSRTKFFISQRNGGPAIQFMSTVEFEEEDRLKVNAGYLGYHKTFWNQVTGRAEAPPEALLILFSRFKRTGQGRRGIDEDR